MEVIVYYNIDKPLFKRVVMCPDAFDIKAFHQNLSRIWRKNRCSSNYNLKLYYYD